MGEQNAIAMECDPGGFRGGRRGKDLGRLIRPTVDTSPSEGLFHAMVGLLIFTRCGSVIWRDPSRIDDPVSGARTSTPQHPNPRSISIFSIPSTNIVIITNGVICYNVISASNDNDTDAIAGMPLDYCQGILCDQKAARHGSIVGHS